MREAAKSHQMILFLLCTSVVAQLFSGTLPLALVLTISQAFTLLLPLMIYLMLTGGGLAQRLNLNPFKGIFLLQGIGVTLVLQPFLMLLATAAEKIAGNPMAAFIESMGSLPAWMTITGLALMPALIEELVFRGALLNGYKKLPLWSAAVLNGIVFGMFHMNLYQFSYAMVLGIFFSVITRRSGSVIPAMGMHFLNNLISVLLVYQLDSRWYGLMEEALDRGTTLGPGMAAAIIVSALSLGAALWLLREKHEDRLPEEREAEIPEKHSLSALAYDWAFIALILIFGLLAVMEPVKAIIGKIVAA